MPERRKKVRGYTLMEPLATGPPLRLSMHPLLSGAGAADSWAIDCHKWLNVPYDSAVAVVRAPD